MTLTYFSNASMRGRKVLAMGHSMGGTVSVACAIRRPDQYLGLVLIDPATLPNLLSQVIGAVLPNRFKDRVPFIKSTRNRRQHWHSEQEFHRLPKNQENLQTVFRTVDV